MYLYIYFIFMLNVGMSLKAGGGLSVEASRSQTPFSDNSEDSWVVVGSSNNQSDISVLAVESIPVQNGGHKNIQLTYFDNSVPGKALLYGIKAGLSQEVLKPLVKKTLDTIPDNADKGNFLVVVGHELKASSLVINKLQAKINSGGTPAEKRGQFQMKLEELEKKVSLSLEKVSLNPTLENLNEVFSVLGKK